EKELIQPRDDTVSAAPIKTTTRRTVPDCCASALSGQAAAEPAIAAINSRRRIASPQTAQECADYRLQDVITAGIYDPRNGGRRSFCVAAIHRSECPLWVRSGQAWRTAIVAFKMWALSALRSRTSRISI